MSEQEELNQEKTSEEISWSEALSSGGAFLKFEAGEKKKIVLTNWRFELKEYKNKNTGQNEEQIMFVADCVREDGKDVEKVLSSSSNPLKKVLEPIFKNVARGDDSVRVALEVIRTGEGYDTSYYAEKIEE